MMMRPADAPVKSQKPILTLTHIHQYYYHHYHYHYYHYYYYYTPESENFLSRVTKMAGMGSRPVIGDWVVYKSLLGSILSWRREKKKKKEKEEEEDEEDEEEEGRKE